MKLRSLLRRRRQVRQLFLCNLCKRIDEPGQLSYPLQDLQPESRCRRRCRNSCSVCNLLWRVLLEFAGKGVGEIYEELVLLEREVGGPMRADLRPLAESEGKVRKLRFQFFVDGDTSFPFKRIGNADQISENGISHACVELAQGWIAECENSHKGCIINNASVLPTRVVKVGSSSANPCLYVSKPGDCARYVALSHCWGGLSPLTTTLKTLEKHVEGISFSDLPLTFRDAVMATRALGVEYVWIDSLCIIQDSHDDWITEAARMGSVYENAYVTISADAASDCQAGFLAKPARKLGRCVSVPFDLQDSRRQRVKGMLYLREKGPLMRQLPVHGWHPASMLEGPPLPKISSKNEVEAPAIPPCLLVIEEAPTSRLSTRGWVMQERMLSPRSLHFGPSEIGWECRSCISCECTQGSLRSRRGGPLLKGSLIRTDWHKTVKEYTRMSLTVANDRLPALSGLASVLSRGATPDDEYICGLWTSTMAQDLLWHRSSIESQARDKIALSPPYAPTWSWACLNQSVEYSPAPPKIAPSFKILNVHCKPTGSNRYGPVAKDSYIEVSGLCVYVREGRDCRIHPSVDGLTESDSWPQVRRIFDHNLPYRRRFFTFLLIADGEHTVEGLLLEHVDKQDTELEGNVYQRRGYAVGIDGAPLKKYKFYSSSSTEYVDVPAGHPGWPRWAGWAKERVLKII